MQVTLRKIQEFTIVDDLGANRIAAVTFTDESPGKGRFVVVAGGMSYSCYWSNMGERMALEFFAATDDAYVVNCLDPFGTAFRRIDSNVLKGIIADDIAKATNLDDAQKVNLTGRLVEITPISDVNGLVGLNSDLMGEIYGPMWATQVNERFLGQHPSYTYLTGLIASIRTALVG